MTGRRRPTAAVVAIAALDMRRRPAHAAEMGSQLLLGETVRVGRGADAGRWLLVENRTDGYRGWARAWGLRLAGPRPVADWRRRATARVTALWSEVREAPGRGRLVTPLFWGSRVIPGSLRGRHRRVELPDGTRGWLPAGALARGRRAGTGLIDRVRGLLGIPYLWGGRTPAGLDCSGLVQMLLAEQGLRPPRDAGDQERWCRPLPARATPRAGDLAFFGHRRVPASHVGVMIDAWRYVHARGRVRVNSLQSDNELYDNELSDQLRSIRRPPRPLASAPPRGSG
jgi:cell wall-associated NlpC family hydrolase